MFFLTLFGKYGNLRWKLAILAGAQTVCISHDWKGIESVAPCSLATTV